jgi:DNA end-binding protein Ku
MARAIWSGSVTFGLVNVPVKAYTAVRDHEVHFHQLEKGTGARIRYQKISEKTSKEVDKKNIEPGYELDHGRYAVVDPSEVDELRPRTTRTIEVSDFVALSDIDPIYYERTYWLSPDGEGARRPYRLLLAAMEDKQRVAIGSVVMRNKQYLAAIRPLDGALAMSTMRFADEVVPRTSVEDLASAGEKPESKELRLAEQIIESLSTEWDPEQYHDTYTEQLRELITKRSKGHRVVAEEESPAAEAQVIDLMSALEASLDAANEAGTGRVPRQRRRAAGRIEKRATQTEGATRGQRGRGRRPPKRTAAAKPRTRTAKKTPARKSA